MVWSGGTKGQKDSIGNVGESAYGLETGSMDGVMERVRATRVDCV